MCNESRTVRTSIACPAPDPWWGVMACAYKLESEELQYGRQGKKNLQRRQWEQHLLTRLNAKVQRCESPTEGVFRRTKVIALLNRRSPLRHGTGAHIYQGMNLWLPISEHACKFRDFGWWYPWAVKFWVFQLGLGFESNKIDEFASWDRVCNYVLE